MTIKKGDTFRTKQESMEIEVDQRYKLNSGWWGEIHKRLESRKGVATKLVFYKGPYETELRCGWLMDDEGFIRGPFWRISARRWNGVHPEKICPRYYTFRMKPIQVLKKFLRTLVTAGSIKEEDVGMKLT